MTHAGLDLILTLGEVLPDRAGFRGGLYDDESFHASGLWGEKQGAEYTRQGLPTMRHASHAGPLSAFPPPVHHPINEKIATSAPMPATM